MTMLVMLMGVLTTNAQNTEDVYSTYSATTIDTDWTLDPDADDVNSAYYNTSGVVSLLATYGSENAKFSMEKEFNLDDLNYIEISYDVLDTDNGTAGPFNYTFDVFVSNDGGSTYESVSENTYTGNPDEVNDLTVYAEDFAPTGTDTYIKLEMTFNQSIPSISGYELIEVKLNDFSIVGYKSVGSVGINENDLSDNLEIYSYNKSVFLTANENMNANVTVYNMSGQVVKTEVMNLSYSKTELNLNDVNTGMYIVNVTNGNAVMQKKVYIH